MTKTIMVTGATDGIGLLTAKALAGKGHTVLIHGRNGQKLEKAKTEIGGRAETWQADLSDLDAVEAMASNILARHHSLDVLINNAGVFKLPQARTADGQDVRFVVNTIAPFILTRCLLPIMPANGRVVNLSSAAQAAIDIGAMHGNGQLDDMSAYAQSKLAITIWTRELAKAYPDGPVFLAVNPGSLLASRMVKEGFGVAGNDLGIGVDILCRASLSDEFANASGQYFDNDKGSIGEPHDAALDPDHSARVMAAVEALAARQR